MSKSPFPGVDPFIEQSRWSDFHTRLATYIADEINTRLPSDLRGRLQKRVYVEDFPRQEFMSKRYVPDVHIHASQSSGGGTAVMEEISLANAVELGFDLHTHERYVEVVDIKSGNRVVTVIEVVSPSNRLPGPGRDAYKSKQRDCVDAGVNLVEIDLVRAGESVTLARPSLRPDGADAPHHIAIWNASKGWVVQYYPIHFKDALPTVGIPLRPSDRRVPLELQRLQNMVFERGRYDDIDYAATIAPRLREPDATWVRQWADEHVQQKVPAAQ